MAFRSGGSRDSSEFQAAAEAPHAVSIGKWGLCELPAADWVS